MQSKKVSARPVGNHGAKAASGGAPHPTGMVGLALAHQLSPSPAERRCGLRTNTVEQEGQWLGSQAPCFRSRGSKHHMLRAFAHTI